MRTTVQFALVALLFNAQILSAADAAPAEHHIIRIVLVGDSTVTDKSGWGLGFKLFLSTNAAECINTAAGGRSSKSFMDEGKWTNALALKGDYYLIQFGHNNEPGKPGRSTDMPTFVSNMTSYVDEARVIGAKPILVTPLTRRQWDKTNFGKIKSSLEPYADEVRKIAAAKNVPLIDLHTRSIEVCEKLGREGCLAFSPSKIVDSTNAVDNTHLNARGSVIFARLVVEELRKVAPELAPFFRAEPACGNPGTNNSVYLFTSFRGNGDGLHLAYSYDAYHWADFGRTFLTPTVGGKLMRDPSLLRGPDGTFHMVWTTAWYGDKGFGYASSKDLIHWSNQKFIPVMARETNTHNVWAPELFYDEREKQFIILWASTIPGRFPDYQETPTNNHRLYVTTTRDFETFTPAKLFFDPDYSVIDGFILKDGNRYVLLHKDNSRPVRKVRAAFADNPLGPWNDVTAPFTEQFTEGPSAVKAGDDWIIYFDRYRVRQTGAVKTRDFKTFTNITDQCSFPDEHRHGTALSVSPDVVENLIRFCASTNAP